jgi:hypothetical protein
MLANTNKGLNGSITLVQRTRLRASLTSGTLGRQPDMTQDEKQTWQNVRKKGCVRYLVHEGLVRCGIPFGVLFGLCKALRIAFSDSTGEPLLSIVATGVLAAAFATAFFGGVMGSYFWYRNEREYAKPADDNQPA